MTPRVGAEGFERIYEASPDPWGYRTSEYEREKYDDTLAALGPQCYGQALEVGCSIGVFTELLAPRCERVLAIDFSERALELARERLNRVAGVEVEHAVFPEQAPDGPWDLVVCSEVLYYLDEDTLRQAMHWLEGQLRSGATVLAVSWRGQGEIEPLRGDEAHDALIARLGRWHAFDGRRPGYRLDRFDGDGD